MFIDKSSFAHFSWTFTAIKHLCITFMHHYSAIKLCSWTLNILQGCTTTDLCRGGGFILQLLLQSISEFNSELF